MIANQPIVTGLPLRFQVLSHRPEAFTQALGAHVVAIDLPRPEIWKRLIATAKSSPGKLTLPVEKKAADGCPWWLAWRPPRFFLGGEEGGDDFCWLPIFLGWSN